MISPEQRAEIDGMDRYAMARLWRFADSGHPLLSGDPGDYFKKRFFDDLGGFSPDISRSLGWGT